MNEKPYDIKVPLKNNSLSLIHTEHFIYGTTIDICEDQYHEFKYSEIKSKEDITQRLEKISDYICAFLNSNSGIIYVGISIEGEVKGISLSDELKREFEKQFYQMVENFDEHVIQSKLISYQFYPVIEKDFSSKPDLYVIVIFIKEGNKDFIYTTPYKSKDTSDYQCFIKLNGFIKKLEGEELYNYTKRKIKKFVYESNIKME